jgi:hypothetical protein
VCVCVCAGGTGELAQKLSIASCFPALLHAEQNNSNRSFVRGMLSGKPLPSTTAPGYSSVIGILLSTHALKHKLFDPEILRALSSAST